MTMTLFLIGMLVGGLLLGSVARLLVPGTQRISLSATTLIGIGGAALGSFVFNLVDRDGTVTETGIATAIGGVIGSVLVLAVFVFVTRRFEWVSDGEPTPIVEVLAGGETATVEFKSTARTNLHTETRDDAIELAIAKTVAGFLNADGGTLIIGVNDSGEPIGLDLDLQLMKQRDRDRYQLWLSDYLETTLGKPALAFIGTRFEPIKGVDVVVVTVDRASAPVFLNEPGSKRTADFYVRMGNSTRKLLTDEFATYRQSRWK